MAVLTTMAANVTDAPSHGHGSCTEFQDAQHLQWQVAQICFAVAFLLPNSVKHHLLILRSAIAIGSLLLATWGATLVCHCDIPIWYTIFTLINLAHICNITYKMYPFKFTAELRNVWVKRFQPLSVSRYQFTKLCSQGSIQTLQKHGNYITEGDAKAGKTVAILLSGRLKAMHEGTFLHYIKPSSFVDSPEFEAASKKDKEEDIDHQVTVTAIEESRLLIWNRAALDKFFKREAFIEAVFHNLIGKDITSKLYKVQDLLITKDEDAHARTKSVVGFRHRMSVSLENTPAGSKENIPATIK